jgi:hypothetical protein
VVNKNGGGTFAVYPEGNNEAFRQVLKMRDEGRVQMFAEADYSENKTAYLWVTNKLINQGKEIIKNRQLPYQQIGKGTPSFL